MRLAVAAVLALAACSSSGDDAPPVDAPVSRPLVFGGDRPVTLQVPDDFDPTKQYPLLLILHGYGAGGFVQQGYLGLNDVANREQLLVLAPEGTTDQSGKQFWNADQACCDLFDSGVDDVAYLGGLLDDVRAAWPVDDQLVAIVGHSNGAFMAYRMACARADVVTAIAGLAGHATTMPACAPARAVSVLHIHGTSDDTVPYETGTFLGVESPGAVDSVGQWATRNQCPGALTAGARVDLERGIAGDETLLSSTGGCPGGGAADLWTIDAGGHLPMLQPRFAGDVVQWLRDHERAP